VDQYVIFLLLGLANGAVFAALALSLVVTYRSSGVVNFATGAVALVTAYTYAFLREGKLLLLLPGLPQSVKVGVLGFWPAATLALGITAVLGLVLYLLVFRPLRTAPPVARAVASIGVMVILTGVMTQRVGVNPVTVGPILPTRIWTVGGVRLSSDRVWFAVVVLAFAGALAGAYRFTSFGLRTRAAAENERGAYLSGIHPDRLAAVNWMISAVVAGVSGILIAPIVPLAPVSYTLFIVPALAAAILGGFQRLLPAVCAGLAIGMLQSEVTYLQSRHSWLPSSGLPELVPLALILAVLVVRARPLPARGALIQRSLGRAPRPRRITLTAMVWAVGGFGALAALHGQWRSALVTSLIFGVISLSLVVVTGYAGQISLAQLTLAGVAGFLLGPLTTSWHVPFPIAPLVAALAAAALGVIVGLPALRVRGLPLAVVTLSLAVAVEALWFHNTDLVPANGKDIAGPTFFGLDLRAHVGTDFPRLSFSLIVLGTLIAVAVGVAKLRTSALGSEMLAVRANERSAAGSGISVVRVKILAFGIGSFIAGLGGALLAYKQSNVTFDSFTVFDGIALFAVTYLAGITSVSGGVLAGLLVANGLIDAAIQRWLSLGNWYTTLTSALLVLAVIRNPEGIVGPLHALLDRWAPSRSFFRTTGARLQVVGGEGTANGTPALSVRNVGVHYGGVVAVDNVSFDVRPGTIVGVIGPNGAGKTTLLDAITGFAPATGSVALGGTALDGRPPYQRVRSGLARTFQHIELYDDLSVFENIVVGRAGRGGTELAQLLDVVDLADAAHRPAGELSQGRRQLVSIARALASNPDVLLLDEPAAGLDSAESAWLGKRLRSIRDAGTTIVLVDHDMHLVLSLCDEVHVLVFGQLVASGPPHVISADADVASAYLGETHAAQPTGAA
jgi:ABC-type branched-subunit amino acid transport system ATPase component/branched-subunit amino acid ABC-type transport system permease component